MGFIYIGVFILVIVLVVQISDYLQNGKHSKATVPRRVTVDHLRENKSNSVVTQTRQGLFNKSQKLAIIACLEMISSGGGHIMNTPKRKAQKAMIASTLVNDFGLGQTEWNNYSKNLTPYSVINSMSTLDSKSKELFFAHVFQVLGCGGVPTYEEITIAENVCDKVAGISNKMFERYMDNIDSMLNSVQTY